MNRALGSFFWPSRLAFMSAVLITAISYLPGILSGVHGEDSLFIYPSFSSPVEEIKAFFMPSTSFGGTFYRPLFRLSFYVDHLLWGDMYAGYHLSNFALHLLCTWLMIMIGKRLGAAGSAILFSSLVFLIHPMLISDVTWLSGRGNLFSGLFALLTIYWALLWVERRKAAHFVLSAVTFITSLLFYEVSVTVPLVLVSVLVLSPPDQEHRQHSIVGGMIHALPYGMISGLYLLFRVTMLSAPSKSISTAQHVFNFLRYFATVLTPFVDSPSFRDLIGFSKGDLLRLVYQPWLIISLLGVIAAGIALICRHRPPIRLGRIEALGLLWCAFSLIPAILYPYFAPRLMYLPLVGLSLTIGSWISRVWSKGRRARALVTLVFAYLIVLNIDYNIWWYKAGRVNVQNQATVLEIVRCHPTIPWWDLVDFPKPSTLVLYSAWGTESFVNFKIGPKRIYLRENHPEGFDTHPHGTIRYLGDWKEMESLLSVELSTKARLR